MIQAKETLSPAAFPCRTHDVQPNIKTNLVRQIIGFKEYVLIMFLMNLQSSSDKGCSCLVLPKVIF